MVMLKFICFALLCASSLFAAEQVKIGIDLALSGTLSPVALMEEVRNGALLAQADLNARPNAPYNYQILVEDNMGSPRGSNSAAQKLISIDKVDALISVFDYASVPVVPLARYNKVPHVAFSWGVQMADNQYNFLNGSTEMSFARALYRALNKTEGPITLLCVRQASIPGFADELTRLLKQDGRVAPTVIFFNSADVDFRQIMMKLQESKAEHLVLMLWGDDLNKFLYQYRLYKQSFHPQFYSIGLLRYAQDRAAVTGAIIAGNPPLPEKFTSNYQTRFKSTPSEYAAFGYDAFKLIADALESSTGGGALCERIAKRLSEMKGHEGICGIYENQKGVFDLTPTLYRLTATAEEPLNIP